MVNASVQKYNVTSPETFPELFTVANGFVGGTVGIAFIFIVWIITYFSLQNYPNLDALKASTWTAWLSSLFMTLLGVVNPRFSLMLFVFLLAATGYSAKPRR